MLVAFQAVSGPRWQQGMAFEDSAQVGVDDENRVFPGVQQDGVGGFRTDTTER